MTTQNEDVRLVIKHVERIIGNLNQYWNSIELLLSHVSKPLLVDDRGLANVLSLLREDLQKFRSDFEQSDISKTLNEFRYMNKRLDGIEKSLSEIKEKGIKQKVELLCKVDDFEMVKKPKGYDPTDLEEPENIKLENLLNTLTNRESCVLAMRLGLLGERKGTFVEIGNRYGITRERASQIYRKALQKLRHPSRKELKEKIYNIDLLIPGL